MKKKQVYMRRVRSQYFNIRDTIDNQNIAS